MELRNYFIYFKIEDSVKEVLYGPEEQLHLLYHRSVCQRFSIDLRYYFIYYIIEVHFLGQTYLMPYTGTRNGGTQWPDSVIVR